MERDNRRSTLAWTDDVVRTAEEDDDPGPGAGRTGTAVDRPRGRGRGQRERRGRGRAGRTRPAVRAVAAAAGRPSPADRAHRLRRKPRAFDETALRIGRLFTAHVGIASTRTVREQLTEAMRSRDLIGQATGILMSA
ncbi:hypothetical protein GCM10023238_39130 [Streptomyces heliomycini]